MARLLLTELIENSPNKTLKLIDDWLISPAHNKKPALYRLFQYFKQSLHELQLEPDEQKAFNAAYPERTFNENVWAKLNYELIQQIENCLAYQSMLESNWLRRSLVLDNYREQGLYRHLKVRLDGYRRSLPKSGAATTERYRYEYQLERTAYFLDAIKKRSSKHNLIEEETSLMRLVLAEKFRQFGKTLAHQRLFKNDFSPLLLDHLIEQYELSPEPTQPGIHLFYLATLLYIRTGEVAKLAFRELKAGISQFTDQFSVLDLRDLLVHAINYGVRQTNAGQLEFMQETLELYQIGVCQKLFYENGEIDIFTFNNIIGLSLRLGEVDYAAQFLEENAHRLPLEKREEVASLNRARLSYQKGDYSQALQQLQTADYQDFIHHLTARVLQMKIYFERDDYNLLISHLRSTKALLRRKKNMGYHQVNYRNIFILTEKITKLPPGDRTAKQKLITTIQQTEPCTEKEWLLKQLK